MAEDTAETGLVAHNEKEIEQVKNMYSSLARGCKNVGLEDKWAEIEDCLKMVDLSMSRRDESGKWVRKKRKNGDLDLSHPVSVATKTIEIAKKHPDLVRLDEVLVEAAVMHDYFEDYDRAVRTFNYRYGGNNEKAAKVMGMALDVTKATALDRRADESVGEFEKRKAAYEQKMEDKNEKFLIKDSEDLALLDHVRAQAEAGNKGPLIIKIADRLHNLETVDGLKQDAFERTLLQSREEFVPLCMDFGLSDEAEEIRRLCLEAEKRRLNKSE